ncbi:hypothetical protein G6O69_18665 [Pseudenhygromyxa sp. WMMC2535]|uniref:hypothetical protein n=1 Tax=Pseudenhygromyxa sp. WMMC2535 TaxID=2712867 RepID=UPI00155474A1|nr:hypothetical protein [Pseudenhygromyxa sp. WMMC2535]NVB39873.1 hypothetical protein [Pseudenhygromyxa sp. WMMC2535]
MFKIKRMPVSHADLVDNTEDFVRDYPFALRDNVAVQGNNSCPVSGYSPAAFQSARDQVCRGEGAREWFTVKSTAANYRWGAVEVSLEVGIVKTAQEPTATVARSKKRAFILPWARNAITRVKLSDRADFFFTAPLTGCTIFVDTNTMGGPTVYHANASDIGKQSDKDVFMQGAFECWSNRAHNAAGVLSYVSRSHIAVNAKSTLAIAKGMAKRTGWHWESFGVRSGRSNVSWLTIGANVMGVRTDAGAWTFYRQVVGILDYDLAKWTLSGGTQIRKHIMSTKEFAVVSTGVLGA